VKNVIILKKILGVFVVVGGSLLGSVSAKAAAAADMMDTARSPARMTQGGKENRDKSKGGVLRRNFQKHHSKSQEGRTFSRKKEAILKEGVLKAIQNLPVKTSQGARKELRYKVKFIVRTPQGVAQAIKQVPLEVQQGVRRRLAF